MIHTGNYSLTDPECSNGDMFQNANLMQALLDTEICVGKTGLTFRNCNLINCVLPKDAVVESSNTCKKEFCSHLHPEMGLTECAEKCSHWKGTEIDDYTGKIVHVYEDGDL